MLRRTIALALALASLSAPAWAGTTRYDPRRSGHPLRIIAYMLHPVGVIADTLVFHPAWWLGTHEPLRTLFGVDVVFDDSAEVARRTERVQPPPEAHPEPPSAIPAPPPGPPPEPPPVQPPDSGSDSPDVPAPSP
ncbi:MAG TPA: hypothetical protein VEN47_07190 [Myxococcota bacterium]|nr:hypothetical protein [Myxococcota bacterium]